MKAIIKMFLIVSLVSLFAIFILGCEEDKKATSASDTQGYTNTAQEDGKTSGTVRAKTTRVAQAETVDITLYFSNDQAEYLVPEIRQIDSVNVEDLAMAAMEELIKGPQESGHHATIPSETKILGIEVNQNVAYVNFSQELINNHWGGSAGELMTIASIVNTLTEFEDIQKVQILVDGKVVGTITGHSDTSKPLARNEAIIKN